MRNGDTQSSSLANFNVTFAVKENPVLPEKVCDVKSHCLLPPVLSTCGRNFTANDAIWRVLSVFTHVSVRQSGISCGNTEQDASKKPLKLLGSW